MTGSHPRITGDNATASARTAAPCAYRGWAKTFPKPLRLTAPRSYNLVLTLLLLAIAAGNGAADAQPTFAEIAPILEQNCTLCHSGANPPLGLRLESYEDVLQGSQDGAVVVPGDAEGSELVRRIRGTSLPRMPLTGPPFLGDDQIELITQWIAAGAHPAPVPASPDAAGEGQAPPAPEERAPASRAPAPGEPVTFAHIEPILLQRCALCHSDNGITGQPPEGLRLDTYRAVLQGGERVVVVPGIPDASELLRRITGRALPRMPLNGPPYLSEEEVRLVREWIAQGAPDAQGRAAAVPAGGDVRLHGTLTGRWALDGLELRITPGTRIEEEVAPGAYVEVRGVLESDGRVRVLRVRTR